MKETLSNIYIIYNIYIYVRQQTHIGICIIVTLNVCKIM